MLSTAFARCSYEPGIQLPEPERKKAAAGFKLATDNGYDDPLIQCLYCTAPPVVQSAGFLCR